MEKKAKRNILAHVKECTDRIYETVIAQQGGYCGGFSQLGSFYSVVLKELVDRGILLKERDLAAPRLAFKYTWAASMAPTKTLYENIAFAIRMTQKKYSERNRQKKEVKPEPAECQKATDDVPTMEKVPPLRNPLGCFSDNDLWMELKSRGYEIADGRLARFLD